MKESDIQAAIMKLLGVHPAVAWAYVTSTGTFRGIKGGRPIKIGYPGMADIIGQMKDGRMLAIEVKLPGKKPTGDQLEFLGTVLKYRGVAGWCTSIEEARDILNKSYS